jgi:hypothetical protein
LPWLPVPPFSTMIELAAPACSSALFELRAMVQFTTSFVL